MRLRRFTARLLIVVMLVALIGVVAKSFSWTPGISGPPGAAVADLVEADLRGVRQWVLVRGSDRSAPVLVFLHGGPGMPLMFLAHAFQRELEEEFLVVHWDRAGAGKSYAAFVVERATLGDVVQDLHALVFWLERRYGSKEIILVGHSWGTLVGMLALAERPELYAAYIGTGQMAADREAVAEARRKYFREEAELRGDTEMLRRLESGDVPGEADLFRYGLELRHARSPWPLIRIGVAAPEYSLIDVVNVPRGAQRLGRAMNDDRVADGLERAVTTVNVPVAFFLGRFDLNEPFELAAAYLERLNAPCKRLVLFDDSAHFPFLEQPELFARELRSFLSWISTDSAAPACSRW